MGDGHSGRTALTGDEPQYKVVGRFEVVRSAGRFLHDQRYNQYHGKDGKFASKNGSGAGGYVPGKWSAGGREDVINVATATILQDMDEGLASPEAYVRSKLEKNLPPSAWVLKNGPHAIFGDKGKPDPRVAAEVDHLQKIAPTHGPIRIFVDSHMPDGVLGETDNFSGNIRLSSKTRYRKQPGLDDGWSMPTAQTHTERQYTLYHEWGHRHAAEMWRDKPVSTQRPASNHLLDMQIDHAGSLSQYGRTNQFEAYAEAFAEWHLSEGKTTNKAAIGYAKEFGWVGANDQRYNKFHAKDGKFASKNGTGGGYVPGQWKGGGREAAVNAAVEGAMPQARTMMPGLSEELVRGWAQSQIEPTIPEGSWVLQNGPHMIFGEHGKPDKRLAAKVDHLQEVAPTQGPIRILITSHVEEGALGMTDMGTGNIQINSSTTYRKAPKDLGHGWSMPASQTHAEREYTLTHEWGHRVNADMYKGKTQDQQLAVEKKLIAVGEPHMDALSEYGQSNQHEAFAEAFAEWHLTGGKTTNEAAVAYAKEFGWRAE